MMMLFLSTFVPAWQKGASKAAQAKQSIVQSISIALTIALTLSLYVLPIVFVLLPIFKRSENDISKTGKKKRGARQGRAPQEFPKRNYT